MIFPDFMGYLEENMEIFLFIAMIALLALGVLLTVAVLMQHGKSYGLSGTIAGGAETFFGKDKGGRIDKILSRVTTVMGIVFVVLVLLVYVLQPGDYTTTSKNQSFENFSQNISSNATESTTETK